MHPILHHLYVIKRAPLFEMFGDRHLQLFVRFGGRKAIWINNIDNYRMSDEEID